MTTKVEKSIQVNVPISTVYNQWTQFEDFPQFMGGVQQVTQLDDRRLHWVAEIGGVKREWNATILEQVPDQKIAWAATEGATNAGAVYFTPVGAAATSVRLSLEYEPEGLVERVGDKLNIVEKRAQADLEKFKEFIESSGYATGAWRGSVNESDAVGTPGVESAESSRGDSGKAGLSAKAVAAAATTAVAAGIAATALKGKSDDDSDDQDTADIGEAAAPSAPLAESPIAYTPDVTTDTYTTGTEGALGAVPPLAAPGYEGSTVTEGGDQTTDRGTI
ncbi:MAG: SRPBCC family protein [Mycobacteriales bacterium]